MISANRTNREKRMKPPRWTELSGFIQIEGLGKPEQSKQRTSMNKD